MSPFGEQVGLYHDLACAIELQSALVERSGRSDAGRPDLERRRDSLTTVEQKTLRVCRYDTYACTHVYAKRAKLRGS